MNKRSFFLGSWMGLMAILMTTYVKAQNNEASNGIAVIELFTSEGCSSCPSADVLLTEWVNKAEAENLAVFPLAFHVDYWDRLGWKDPYGDARFSERQRNYARNWEFGRVYTPQLVVNGQAEMVGSERPAVEREIKKALNEPAPVSIEMKHRLLANQNRVEVDFLVSGKTPGNVINVAIVERELKSDVQRGENAGRKLRHDNTVRSFLTSSLDENEGKVAIDIPENLNIEKAYVIAYVQNGSSLKILGASGAALQP